MSNRTTRRNSGTAVSKPARRSNAPAVIETPYFAIVVKNAEKATAFANDVAECHADRLNFERKVGRRFGDAAYAAMFKMF